MLFRLLTAIIKIKAMIITLHKVAMIITAINLLLMIIMVMHRRVKIKAITAIIAVMATVMKIQDLHHQIITIIKP
jgi:hypothetical protein